MASSTGAKVAAFHSRYFDAVSALKLGAQFVVFNMLETGEPVRDRAHVAPALHVVLAAQRVHAAAVTTDVAREEGEIDEGHYIIDGVVMLGDAERPADDCALCLSICMSGLADNFRGNTRFAFCALQGIFFDALAIGFKSTGGVINKLLVGETRNDDFPPHGVGERDVSANIQTQPHVCPLGRSRTSRVDNKHPRAVA